MPALPVKGRHYRPWLCIQVPGIQWQRGQGSREGSRRRDVGYCSTFWAYNEVPFERLKASCWTLISRNDSRTAATHRGLMDDRGPANELICGFKGMSFAHYGTKTRRPAHPEAMRPKSLGEPPLTEPHMREASPFYLPFGGPALGALWRLRRSTRSHAATAPTGFICHTMGADVREEADALPLRTGPGGQTPASPLRVAARPIQGTAMRDWQTGMEIVVAGASRCGVTYQWWTKAKGKVEAVTDMRLRCRICQLWILDGPSGRTRLLLAAGWLPVVCRVHATGLIGMRAS
ncbi:hypothetical protein FKP32DRAFT_1601873 [Trametes sanguinea]|nr:hypothetical protein FKP32DRAFT_1601873 [Trametes sanguinea]